jgi:hypothetical protein
MSALRQLPHQPAAPPATTDPGFAPVAEAASSAIRLQRRVWVLLLCVLLNSGLWMDALHHHDDFSRDNPDCLFCQVAASPAVSHSVGVTPQVFLRLPERLPIRFELHVRTSSRILHHSPKTGPPPLSSLV